ncbi:amidohydrolase family protein [Reyranella sp. CPCC 100927]|uniref:N-acyl-D-amino-acid deacylase family protein n=1 Tax=Reyranella sp. CPCC 100927 TaxID=2599616 RepID=UPI0011B5568E|nr:amidohydrolase family protein [Reyranella sp. CPCC 100927]TWS97829.1 amidohydrolase family protein [Reyranella sp. CPCC 100927]
MAAQFDLVVRDGTVFDGTGGAPRAADIGVRDGRIDAIGRFAGAGREEIDARGMAVTPGFVDIHTHYDGQVTWDDRFTPSSGHGVTTVVMGNCGVGFAPCRPQDRDTLIKVMEGVEDIPELVMRQGVPWNWQSFPEYLDALAARRCDIDFATQVPHAPLRVFVMGRRGVDREPATATDMAAMASMVEEGLEAGALGFTTSRSLFHRTPDGALTPTITAAEEELAAIARGMGRIGKGVIQLLDDFQDTTADGATEFAMLRRLVTLSRRPLSFTLLDISLYPGRWETLLREVERANRDGLPIRGQVAARPVAILYGLELSFHPFSTCPSYRAIADLPLPQKLARLRDPALRARLLAEEPVYSNPQMLAFMRNVGSMFVLGDPPDYTPAADRRLDARAAALGVSPLELAYDLLVANDGRTILFHPGANYSDCSDANMARMLRHEHTVMALGDGGAHYGLICDASYTTHALTYWTRDRRGERWPLAWTVQQLTDVPARTVGLGDRGRLAVGYKADINVIDVDRLRVAAPHPVHNLPGGGRRLEQKAEGYRATIVGGNVTYRDGAFTGALPGRLVRGARSGPSALG